MTSKRTIAGVASATITGVLFGLLIFSFLRSDGDNTKPQWAEVTPKQETPEVKQLERPRTTPTPSTDLSTGDLSPAEKQKALLEECAAERVRLSEEIVRMRNSIRVFSILQSRSAALSGDVREQYDRLLTAFANVIRLRNPDKVPLREASFIEDTFYMGWLEVTTSSAWFELLHALDAVGPEREAQMKETLKQVIDKYGQHVNSLAEDIDEKYGLPELPLSDPVFDVADQERSEANSRVYFSLLEELSAALPPDTFEKLSALLADFQLPTLDE